MKRRESLQRAVLLLGCLIFGPLPSAIGEEKAASKVTQEQATTGTNLGDSLSFTSRKEPIHITSRDLEFRYNEKKALYRGDVVATQGDATLKSDLLTVTYEETTPTSGTATGQSEGGQPQSVTSRQHLKEIVAEGHVEITSGDRHATSKKAIFDELGRTVVLSGDVVLQENGNHVTGEKVTVYLDEKRTVVEGGEGKRPETILIPQQQEDGKKGAKRP